MAARARAVSRRPSALTRLVDRLERRGLLQRIRHTPTDVSVSLTECGRPAWSGLTANPRDGRGSVLVSAHP
ncbi:MAG: MarR family transcriptional regulator [Actinomycetales bacterium]|nr:MarR family transcriptional regulator [Actinomycetales bacterium]